LAKKVSIPLNESFDSDVEEVDFVSRIVDRRREFVLTTPGDS
jgi:hypothetical protein